MPGKKRGRPKINVDLDDVKDLAEQGNSAEHIAKVLGFSKSTLFGRKDVREAYEKGLAEMCVNLREWQMNCAKSGNVTMLIWLGRQYLGQKDHPDEYAQGQLSKVDEIMRHLDEASRA